LKLAKDEGRRQGEVTHALYLLAPPSAPTALNYSQNKSQSLATAAKLSVARLSGATLAAERVRLEVATGRVENGAQPIVVYSQTGLCDRQRVPRTFLCAFGRPPQSLRAAHNNHTPSKAAALAAKSTVQPYAPKHVALGYDGAIWPPFALKILPKRNF
jgi:hypothetical protein